ncbi:hypothetical protein ACP4OV_014574 [Aristida adscensionis]
MMVRMEKSNRKRLLPQSPAAPPLAACSTPRPSGEEAPSMASGADRISDLPEGVLHHVLSLLAAEDAVRTCVLARRWRDLWRSAPAVRVAGSAGWRGGLDAFVPFVDQLLRARREGEAAPLDSCDFDLDLDLDRRDAAGVERPARHGNSWIRRALRRGVEDLRFRIRICRDFTVPLALSQRPLISPHLTRLELRGVDGNPTVLDFSGCPALVELTMRACGVGSREMHSPSLKRLTIECCFLTNLGRAPLLKSMPLLEAATVRLYRLCDDHCTNGRSDDCGDAACEGCYYYYYGLHDYDCVFLEGLTEATCLDLSAYPELYVFNRDLKFCPPFNKLKTLTLQKWFLSADLSELTWFLQHAPLLEKLTIRLSKANNRLMETDGSYKPLEQPFSAGHLKFVEIICKNIDGIVLKILEVLNANGVSLEKIRIWCSGRFNFLCTDVNSR